VTLFVLNIVIVLEPAIAIAMGALLFGARVTALQLGGGVLLAAAVVVGLKKPRAAPTP
jgi:drug/metabolite transporter (DMT)-like permease